MTDAEQLLNDAIRSAGLSPASSTPYEIFIRQAEIRDILAEFNQDRKAKTGKPISVGSTGWITERICEYGLQSVMPNSYSRMRQQEKWIGDFNLIGYPIGAVISVKSFAAKERLLASGLGMILVPTLGFGWFDDPREFKAKRCTAYRDRGFLAIYMPGDTLGNVEQAARDTNNINGQPLLRDVLAMPDDFQAAIQVRPYGAQHLKALNTRLL